MMQFCDRLSQLLTGQEQWWLQRYVLLLVQLRNHLHALLSDLHNHQLLTAAACNPRQPLCCHYRSQLLAAEVIDADGRACLSVFSINRLARDALASRINGWVCGSAIGLGRCCVGAGSEGGRWRPRCCRRRNPAIRRSGRWCSRPG